MGCEQLCFNRNLKKKKEKRLFKPLVTAIFDFAILIVLLQSSTVEGDLVIGVQ